MNVKFGRSTEKSVGFATLRSKITRTHRMIQTSRNRSSFIVLAVKIIKSGEVRGYFGFVLLYVKLKMNEEDFIVDFFVNLVEELETANTEPPRRRASVNVDPFDLTNAEFSKHFRLSKELALELINMIEPVIEQRSQIDIKIKVLCALHFFGTGSYQTPSAKLNCISISQPSASRCISEVVDALNHPDVFGRWVRFPNNRQELHEISRSFYMAYGFPGIIGCIDCTHISIVTPQRPFEERSYVNRKNYHSINTQLICDSNLRILNVNALFPGSTHDSYIWNSSNVLPVMEQLHRSGYQSYHLIGDSGYALRPWCLTPILHAEEGTAEYRYSEALKKPRSTIERCNGVLKGRFRCLLKDRVLHYKPNKATKIINACCVLHNMCITNNFPEPNIPLDEDLGIIDVPQPPIREREAGRANMYLTLGREKQNRIVNNYFN